MVICDAGPLIALGKLRVLPLLHSIYREVLLPRGVYDEVVTAGLARGAAEAREVRAACEAGRWRVALVGEGDVDRRQKCRCGAS